MNYRRTAPFCKGTWRPWCPRISQRVVLAPEWASLFSLISPCSHTVKGIPLSYIQYKYVYVYIYDQTNVILSSLLCSDGMKYTKKFFFSSCLSNSLGSLKPSEQMCSGEERAQSINSQQLFHMAQPMLRSLTLQDVILQQLLSAFSAMMNYRWVLETAKDRTPGFWISLLDLQRLLVRPWASHVISMCGLISVVPWSVKQGQHCILSLIHNLPCVFGL